MPRKKRGAADSQRPVTGYLADRLAEEIRTSREFGQPLIDEQTFPSDKIRIVVIWDEWDRLSLADRTAIILHAYDLAEGREYRERIALASGLTVPEAYAAGMLPYQVLPALRKSDPVTASECRKAMMEEGASTLLTSDEPQLRFSTREEAEACQQRLSERLPNSDPVWVIAQDVGKIEDWAHA